MDLYFIRHAETVFNVEKKYYGVMNPPLTEQGIKRTITIANELSHLEFDQIYTSGLERTRQTAAIICRENQWSEKLIRSHPQLNEMNFGSWEGLTANQVAAVDSVAWANFMNEPFAIHPTGGESFASFKKRVLEEFSEIIKENKANSTLLFVGHLGALRLIIQHYFEPETDYFNIEFSKAALKNYILGE